MSGKTQRYDWQPVYLGSVWDHDSHWIVSVRWPKQLKSQKEVSEIQPTEAVELSIMFSLISHLDHSE